MDFNDSVVLITGASTGIGRSLAIELAARGAMIVGCARSRERLEEMLRLIESRSPSSMVMGCDVGQREQVQTMVRQVVARFGRIDVLINNAGVGMRSPFAETPLDTIEAIMRTNYLGAVYCTHEVLPGMLQRGNGHIVNISSIAGKMGSLNLTGYCASKFALNGFSESLYHELKPRGVRVSVICPGPVRTEFNKAFAGNPPKAPAFLAVEPDAVARAVVRAIERERFEIVLPRSLATISWVGAVMPSLFRALAHRVYRTYVKERAPGH
jgi:uncharacterized protein